MIYEKTKNVFNFEHFETMRSFGDIASNVEITIDEVAKKLRNLLNTVLKSNSRTRPNAEANKKKKRYLWNHKCSLWRKKISS